MTKTLPRTAQDWQLYCSKSGVGVAARSLNAALRRLLKEAEQYKTQGYVATRQTVGLLIGKHLYPVMERYSAWGATDTEPRCVAYEAVENALGLNEIW
jgi:hypothetical protein